MRRRIAAVIPLAVLALVALTWIVLGKSGGERAGGATRSDVRTAEVQRRTLAEQVTVDGTIGYAGKATVVNRLSGTITDLPKVGEVIRRGQALFGVDGKPVILMYGELPGYRRLANGVADGEDVHQLEENLAVLGFDPGTVDDEFTSATAAAVSDWQDDLGLPLTGAMELGRAVFLPSTRRVTKIMATLGSEGGSGSGLAASGAEASGETTLVAYRTSIAVETGGDAPAAEEPAPDSGSGNQPSGGPQQQGNPQPQPTTPQTSPAAGGDGDDGSASTPSTPVLETSSTKRIVSADLDADQQDLARRGQRVGVTLPDGREAAGRVTRLEAVESSSDQGAAAGGGTEAAVEATIKLIRRGRIPALDGAAVSVTLTDDVRRDVLTVPLTALISIGGDRFAVIAAEVGQRRRIVVTPRLAAEGYVEVQGKGLREGMEVEAPE